ncbi:MAG: serine/threonine-protein phosphatase [Phycisphaeraceae bacterium]|nr:MAG: serine/threonine-protein phosphatase [Phycisphaeraceae bacterium]
MTSTFTSEFGREFEQERGRWLRRRLMWYIGVMLGLSALGVLGALIAQMFLLSVGVSAVFTMAFLITSVVNIPVILFYIWAFLKVKRTLLSQQAALRLVYWLIVLPGALSLITNVAMVETGFGSQIQIELSDEAASADEPEALEESAEAAPDAAEEIAGSDADVAAPEQAASDGAADDRETAEAVDRGEPAPESDLRERVQTTAGSLSQIFFAHFFACLFLPWTPRESFRPLLPLLGLNALIVLFYLPGWLAPTLLIAFSPLVAAPGAAICWWRHSRFRKRYHLSALRGRYGEMKRELTDARRIHEALFPEPIRDGDVRFDFVYEPMRQIGGDYLYCHRFPGLGDDAKREPVSVVIIDVTGHGVPAALTVNRLHGELERLFGEEPDISPGDVLTALNSYVHLTLANHSVYATALCLRVDPRQNTLEWASGGHPPAFVRSVDGRLERLDSTAFVLGACHGDDFQSDQRSLRFLPGDTLIAYTDGAIEARDQRGGMLRVEGLQAIIHTINPRAVADGGWAGAVLEAVDQHRWGPAADDTLIVEMYRPL